MERWAFNHAAVGHRKYGVTHRPILIASYFRTFRRVTVNVRNHGLNIDNTVMDVGNDHMGVHRKLDLQVNSQQ